MKQNTITQGKRPHTEAAQGNLIGRIQRAGQRVRDTPVTTVMRPTKKANSHYIKTEDLVQTHAGFMLAALDSVNSYVPCLVDSASEFSWFPPSPLTPSLSFPSSKEFSKLQRKGT